MSIDLGNDRLSIGNQLVRAAWRHPDKEAVTCKGKRITFKELNDRVNSLAHGLMEMGIKKGDFVAILMLNSIEYVEAYFALSKMGATAAPLNYRLTPGDIEKLINQCEPVALIFSSEFKDLVERMRPNIKSVKHYIFVGEEKVENTIAYEKLATVYPTAEPDMEIFRDDGQCMNYTSGTTGLPKASIMTHYNNLMQITQIFMEFSPDSNWVFMTVFPMFPEWDS